MSESTSHIDVSLELADRQIDLRVPTCLSLQRLKDLIAQCLDEQGIRLPLNWELRLKDKDFRLGACDRLDEFPVADGDLFSVVDSQTAGAHWTGRPSQRPTTAKASGSSTKAEHKKGHHAS